MNISFVYPGFLYALALLAIPVIIHLFNFRKFRKVFFTNVRFLTELKQETTSRSKLKHLLVLAARILAVIFLVLAFAQPYIPAKEGVKLTSERVVSIYIDNSFSMDAVTREGTLLDVAKKTAREIASSYKSSDRFHLLTNDFDPVRQRLITREEFLANVDGVKTSPVTRTLEEVLARQEDILNQKHQSVKHAVLISDFQESATSFDTFRPDSSISVTLLPVAAGRVANISVDSCWLSTPVVQLGQLSEVNVRIHNYGEMDASAVPVKLSLNGSQKGVAAADVPAMGFVDIKLTFTASDTGWQKGVISIVDNPITFDDNYYFSFHVSQSASLLSINQRMPASYLKALFSPDGYFKLSESNEQQIDYSSLSRYQLIFLNQLNNLSTGLEAEIAKYIRNGGTLVLIPDSALDFASYQQFFSMMGISPFTSFVMNTERVDKLSMEDKIYEGVFSNQNRITSETDLPTVNGYYLQSGGSTVTANVLMKLRSGAPLLSRYSVGKGEMYLFSVPFSGGLTNFTRHALFVPVIYRMALLSERGGALAYFIGKDDQIELPSYSPGGDNVFHLRNSELQFDAIPAHRSTGTGTLVALNNMVTTAGNYELVSGSSIVAMPSFNYNRAESVMKFYDSEKLEEVAKSKNMQTADISRLGLSESLAFVSSGTPLWKYCIILVLLFLAAETLLLKLWKK